MSKTPVKERRISHRQDAALTLQGTPEEGGVVVRMVTRNLSTGGLYCTSTADFPEMTRLAVRLMLPLEPNNGSSTSPVDLEAVVVRRRELAKSSSQPRYEFALFFTRVEEAARDQIERYIRDRSIFRS